MWSILFALSACVTAPPTFEEYAQAWAEAQCADIDECSGGLDDIDACVASNVDSVTGAYGYVCEDDPDLYDRAAAAACLARYAQPGCMADSDGDAVCDPAYICAQGPYAP